MSNDNTTDTDDVMPTPEIIHLALVRERFERTQLVEDHEDKDTIVVYVELMRGFQTWSANTLTMDLERVRRGEHSPDDELRDPETDYERLKVLEVLREMHDELGRQWGLLT